LVSKVNERKDLGLSTIKATEAAVNFYKEQAKAKRIFDANEKENDEFWEAVRTLISCPCKYTSSVYWQDSLTSVWEDRWKENSFLERDCRHGYDCAKINDCNKCTPDWEVKLEEKKREERYRLEHHRKSKSKGRRKREVKRY
jgi:hypothetical protein